MTDKALLLGVDLGGSKIEAALIDHTGVIVKRKRCATPADDYTDLLRKVSGLCVDLERSVDLSLQLPLGIGTPGSPSPATGLMRNCNSTVLNGKFLLADLETHCKRAVRIANDADCLVLSEARDGAGATAQCIFGAILGTGVGGGLFVNGTLLRGPNAVSGEWGHNRLALERVPSYSRAVFKSRDCYCGRQDCIETWLSGPGLALTHETLHGAPIVMQQLLTQEFDAKHRETLTIYGQMLAAALAGIVNIVDPDVIVLGGGLSNIKVIYDTVPELLKSQVFSDVCTTRVCAAQHGDSSGVRGAAWLWQDNSTNSTATAP